MGSKKPGFFYGWIVVIASLLIMIVVYGTMYSFGVFFKPLLAEFGWTRAMTSGAFSFSFVLHGLLCIVSGRLTDRFGPRIVMTGGGFFLGLGYLLMSQISAVWHLYLVYGVIIAVGVSCGFVPLASTAARWFVKRRGMVTGIVVSGISAGTVIVPPIASWLIGNHGWRTSYIIIGIVALVLIILAAQFLKRDPSQVGQLPYGESEVGQESSSLGAREFSLREAIHTRQFWLLGAILFCFVFYLQAIMVHIVPYATDLEISSASAATILTIIGGLGIGGRLIMGSASDRIGNKPSFIASFIIMSLALFWLLAAKEIWALYLFAVAFGFAYGGVVVLESPIVAKLFGLRSHGVILGVIGFICTIGGAIGPIMAGRIFDVTSSYHLAFLVCVIVSVIGLILALLLKPISKGSFAAN